MEIQPQNPEFRINPDNFHPWKHRKSCMYIVKTQISPDQTVCRRSLINDVL